MLKVLLKGVLKENPLFILLIGLCPAIAVTSRFSHALGLGAAVICVLLITNALMSLLRSYIPAKTRLFAILIITSALVTVIDLCLKAFLPDLSRSLGIFVPLIAVNCLILGRAETYAIKNGVAASILDSLGMGLGFTAALCLIAFIREALGAGSITLLPPPADSPPSAAIIIPGLADAPLALIATPVGAFLVLGFLLGLFNARGAMKTHVGNWIRSIQAFIRRKILSGRERG
jgi:electron transport complex protein RnfE